MKSRRKRRQQNMVLRSGGKFRINHRSPHGRTGMVQAKRTPGSYQYRSHRPNPPDPE